MQRPSPSRPAQLRARARSPVLRQYAVGVRGRAGSVLLAALAIAVVVLATLAGSASAYDPEYYGDPAYATALTSLAVASGATYAGASLEAGMNVGGSYASASQAPTIRKTLLKARLLAKTVPALRTLGTIGLGITAFDIGWKVGRATDTKFLHLSALAAGEIGFGDTYGLVRNVNPWEWRWTASASEWRLRVYSEYGSPCGLLDTIPSTFPGKLLDLYGTDRTTCKQFLLDAYVSLASVVGSVGATQSVSCPSTFFGSTYTGTPATCFRIVTPEVSMDNYLISKVDAFTDWTGQPYDKVTASYDPSYSAQGFASQAAQDAAFSNALSAAASDSPGEFADFAVNPSGTVPNPLIDFEMPNCWGLSVSDCEDAISEAADAVDKTVTFNVTTAPYPNGDIARNVVLATFPAASSMARPDVVALTENPSSAPQKSCKTETDNPHPSEHNPTMQTQGRVKCNFTGESSYQMWMWECSSTQTSDPGDLFDDVLGGAFGCDLKRTTSGVVGVVAMSLLQSGGSEIRCPNILEQSQPYVAWGSGFWIGGSVTTNPSPVENYPPSVSATGVQHDDPGW